MREEIIEMRKCAETGVYYPQSHFLVFHFPTIGHKIISKYNKDLWDESAECTREEQRAINNFVKRCWEEINEKENKDEESNL